MKSQFIMSALAATFLVSTPSLAFALDPASSAETVDPNKKLPDGTTPAERANTARLNAEQATKARAENTAFELQVAAAKQEVARNEAEFLDETAAYEAEKARIAALSAEERAEYEAAVAAWKADVAACKAGDTQRCAKPKPAVPQAK